MNNPEFSASAPIRIILLETCDLLIGGLRTTISTFPGLQLLSVCKDTDSATNTLAITKTDILIVSLVHAVPEHVRFIETIRLSHPRLRMIVLLSQLSPEQGTRLLANGVNGIIRLTDSSTTIIQTILNVHENGNSLDVSLIGMPSDHSVINHSRTNDTFNLMDQTTNREREILRLLASGCSSVEIGKILFISNHTVNTHRKNLMQKAGAKNSAQLIQMAYSSGILNGAQN